MDLGKARSPPVLLWAHHPCGADSLKSHRTAVMSKAFPRSEYEEIYNRWFAQGQQRPSAALLRATRRGRAGLAFARVRWRLNEP
jgi:hypothetical protein